MFLKNKLIIFLVFFSFLIIGNQALASDTNGTINTTYHYAWGENVGWVDFANVAITDSTLSGSAYGENIGWLDLSTITNNAEGSLSGYAWGENVGWVDFSQVTISTAGVFAGSVYGENIGWITFGTGDNKVATDWRPASTRGGISSSGSRPKITTPAPTQISSVVTCKLGEKFNTATGLPCASFVSMPTPVCSIVLTLKQGSRGEEVKCLQTILNLQENQTLVLDGIFGRLTKASVIIFQTNHQLKPDGIVGPLTRAIINNIKN